MAELLKISELAARAGVVKSTIQHYIREGLIPRPRKRPHRNMHYYSSDLVERIRLIKDLQRKRNLPLSTIKKMLADVRGIEEIRAHVFSQPALPDPGSTGPVSREKLLADSGFPPAHLDELEAIGFISPKRRGKRVEYEAIDAAIVLACASMRRAGLSEDNGFGGEELGVYLKAMRELIAVEMALFSRVLDELPREQIIEMARTGLEGTNTLLINLRRKLFLRVLDGADQALLDAGRDTE